MGWLEFFADIIHSTAWPITIVVIVILLAKPLSDLVPLLRKLKYKELELEFQEKVHNFQSEIPLQQANPNISVLASHSTDNKARILEAWKAVDQEIRKLLDKHAIVQNRGWQTHLSELKAKESKFDDILYDLIRVLKEMRDRVLDRDDFYPSSETADGFIHSSKLAIESLQSINEQQKQA